MCVCITCRYRFYNATNLKSFCIYECIDERKKRFEGTRMVVLNFNRRKCDNYQPIYLMDRRVLISVITLGTRNDLLEKTIRSINEYNDIKADVIITVDGICVLPDDLQLKNVEISYVNKRVGICEALNISIVHRLHEYTHVVFMDDDIQLCSRISEYIQILNDHPTIGIVSGYHDCRLQVTQVFTLPAYGMAFLKPITSGCHLVMRVSDIQKMVPFQGGHWVRPYIGFDEWVTRDAETCIKNMGKAVVSIPYRVKHLGEGRSTWEGKENADAACRA